MSNIKFGNNEIPPNRMSTKCVGFVIIDKWKTAFMVACKLRCIMLSMAENKIYLATFSGTLPYR